MAWMYVVRCSDGSFYTGSTLLDPDLRVWEHNNDDDASANFTRRRRPVELVHAEQYEDLRDAFAREKQVQGWSRAKKQAMIDGRYERLPDLSRSRAAAPHASTGSAGGGNEAP